MAAHIARHLRVALPEYEAVDTLEKIPVELQGLHERNPVNLPRHAGVQIELPPRARGVGSFWADHNGDALVPHTRALIDGLVAAVDEWTDRRHHAARSSRTVAAVHSDRELIEERITRELRERVLPRVERAAVPLTVTAGPTREQQSSFVVGSVWGPPWGTTWFVLTGAVPDEWSGQRVEAIIDLGFRADPPGFQCEALVVDDRGRPVQGIHLRRYAICRRRGAGARDDHRRSGIESVVPAVHPIRIWARRRPPVSVRSTASAAPIWR